MKYRLFVGLALLWAVASLTGCMLATEAVTAITTPTSVAPTPTRKPLPDSDATSEDGTSQANTPQVGAPKVGTPKVGARKGDLAPDFTLDSLDDESISLSQFRGQTVLINFWAVWCAFCRVEMPDIQQVYEAYKDRELAVLGINVGEDAQSIEPFVESAGVTFPILLDRDGEVMQTYRMRGLPSTILIDPDGVIQTIHIGMVDQEKLVGYLEQMGVEP